MQELHVVTSHANILREFLEDVCQQNEENVETQNGKYKNGLFSQSVFFLILFHFRIHAGFNFACSNIQHDGKFAEKSAARYFVKFRIRV